MASGLMDRRSRLGPRSAARSRASSNSTHTNKGPPLEGRQHTRESNPYGPKPLFAPIWPATAAPLQCDPRLRLPHVRLTAPIAGGAAHAAALYPARQVTTIGKINGVLQALLAPANRYWRSLHHFRPPLRRGHANMVDRWLIPARNQAEKVVGRRENH